MPRDVEVIADVVINTVRDSLAPVLERLAAAEARLGALTDVRDRLVVVETKAALVPPPVDVGPLSQRQEMLETALAEHVKRAVSLHDVEIVLNNHISFLKERLALVEGRAAIPGPPGKDGAPGRDGEDAHLTTAVSLLDKDIGALRERVAVVETRGAMPGPPGKDGAPGKDGQDGIALDDLSVTQDDERTVTFRARVGQETKTLGTMTVPVEIYRGVWVDGRTYDGGDGVTWGGSEWHCNTTTTTKPGEGSKAWTLKVKRGRDGKDGRDATGALPIVKVS